MQNDRGRILIRFGEPDEIQRHAAGAFYNRNGGITETFPFELWRYRTIAGVGNNVSVEFVDSSLMLCCPMTTQIKGYPFEVLIAGAPPAAVLADQIKSVDWRSRRAVVKGTVSAEEMADVSAKILTLVG